MVFFLLVSRWTLKWFIISCYKHARRYWLKSARVHLCVIYSRLEARFFLQKSRQNKLADFSCLYFGISHWSSNNLAMVSGWTWNRCKMWTEWGRLDRKNFFVLNDLRRAFLYIVGTSWSAKFLNFFQKVV